MNLNQCLFHLNSSRMMPFPLGICLSKVETAMLILSAQKDLAILYLHSYAMLSLLWFGCGDANYDFVELGSHFPLFRHLSTSSFLNSPWFLWISLSTIFFHRFVISRSFRLNLYRIHSHMHAIIVFKNVYCMHKLHFRILLKYLTHTLHFRTAISKCSTQLMYSNNSMHLTIILRFVKINKNFFLVERTFSLCKCFGTIPWLHEGLLCDKAIN